MKLVIRAAVLVALLAGVSLAQSLEYRVKAAFLMNFTRFVEWPSTAFPADTAPISICVFGDDPFGDTIDQLVRGESVHSHRLVVHRVKEMPSAGSCQVLFIDRTRKDVPSVLAAVGPGVLTVGEGEEFIRNGGIIAFVIDNRRVRFDINQSAAAKAELRMNAKLLSVARSVER